MFVLLLILVSILEINGQQIDVNNPVVNTTLGLIRGRRYENKSKFNSRTIISFIGIPYAKKLTSNDRFKV